MAKRLGFWAVCAVLAMAGCKKADEPAGDAPGAAGTADAPGTAKGPKSDKGVDVANKVIRVGALNDESGPASIIGKPYAAGKRILAAQVNAGGSGILPDGWKIEMVERDHQYNPQKSVQEFNAIKDDVLFIATSFGTPNTLPLLAHLKRDSLVAFPASLASVLAARDYTPPFAPTYNIEAMRALDWIVEHAKGAENIKAGVIFQNDDYGKDGRDGFRAAAKKRGVSIVAEQGIAPGQQDFTSVLTALKSAGANYVMMTLLPSATGPILGTAAKVQFAPIWIGNITGWIDRFFDASVIPPEVFANYHVVTGLTYWGEDRPGMKEFLAAFEKHGGDAKPDLYILASYVQGRSALEVAKRAIENGDISRAGYMKALRSVDKFDAGGLIQPVSFSKVPYQVSDQTRVLKPNFDKKSWDVVGEFAAPTTLGK